MNDMEAVAVRSWNSAARLVLGLSIALAFLAGAISETTGGEPGWMIPGSLWGCVLALVLFLEAARQRRSS